MMKRSSYDGPHPYIIVFGVKTEEKLLKALDWTRSAGYTTYEFNEPDRGGELTAFATDVVERSDVFKRFQLLK